MLQQAAEGLLSTLPQYAADSACDRSTSRRCAPDHLHRGHRGTLRLQKQVGFLPSLQGRARDHAGGLDQGEFVGRKRKNPMDQVHWVW